MWFPVCLPLFHVNEMAEFINWCDDDDDVVVAIRVVVGFSLGGFLHFYKEIQEDLFVLSNWGCGWYGRREGLGC